MRRLVQFVVSSLLLTACGQVETTAPSSDAAPAGDADGADDASSVDATTQHADAEAGDASIIVRRDASRGGPACPETPDGPCGVEGAVCEFGTDPSVACDTLGTCTAGTLSLRAPSGQCPTGDAGVGPDCPGYERSVMDFPDGAPPCKVGTLCDYPQGRCKCTNVPALSWSCVEPAPQCSAIRPRLGTPCSQPALVCTYEACPSIDAPSELCADGIWIAIVPPLCPR